MPSMCLGLKGVGVSCEVYSHESKNPNDKFLKEAGIPVHLKKRARFTIGQILDRGLIEGINLGGSIAHIQNIWDPALHHVAKECRKRGTPYVISPRGMLEPWSLKQKRMKKQLGLAIYQLKDLKEASCIHATAVSEMEHIRALGVECPIAVIPNGIKTSDYTEKDYNAPRIGKKRMLFLSRIHPKKGIDLLLKAWNLLPKELTTQWELVIAGEGGGDYTLDDLKAMIAKDFAHLDVIVAGPQYGEAKTKIYQSADVFVLPTWSENFGMVIAEAMCCGVPVITTTGTPWTELKEKNLGWYIDLSVENLKVAITDAMSLSDKELHDMGRRSREHILKEYSIEAVATKYKALYGWLMGENEKPEFVYTNNINGNYKVGDRPLRVLQTISGMSAVSGGPSTCTRDLLEGLQTIGANVDLLTFANENNLGRGASWLKEIKNDGITPFKFSCSFRKALVDSDYDIYHCNAIWVYCNHITCKTARDKKKPYVLSPHGMLYPTALAIKPWKKWPALKMWFNKDIHSATCIHATCQQEAEYVREFGYKGPIAVIPNPVVIPEYLKSFGNINSHESTINLSINNSSDQNDISRKKGEKAIGFLGRLHPIKKVENILYGAANAIKDGCEYFTIEIMGKGDDKYEEFLRNEAERLGIADRVHFVGFVNGKDKYDRLAKLWALFVPSVQENFGMIVPEALICGTPVYASLGTPWSELNGIPSTSMTHDPIAMTHRCGWWKDNSPETIANVIHEIMGMDESQCIAMGVNGRKLIEEKYEQHSVAGMMRNLYKWIVEDNMNPKTKPFFVQM